MFCSVSFLCVYISRFELCFCYDLAPHGTGFLRGSPEHAINGSIYPPEPAFTELTRLMSLITKPNISVTGFHSWFGPYFSCAFTSKPWKSALLAGNRRRKGFITKPFIFRVQTMLLRSKNVQVKITDFNLMVDFTITFPSFVSTNRIIIQRILYNQQNIDNVEICGQNFCFFNGLIVSICFTVHKFLLRSSLATAFRSFPRNCLSLKEYTARSDNSFLQFVFFSQVYRIFNQ